MLKDEELLDWWTRFFETLKDMEGLQEAPKKTLFGKALPGFEDENKVKATLPLYEKFSKNHNIPKNHLKSEKNLVRPSKE